ncbi:MAG TPA: hypothetical protein VGU03_00835 [Frateuria sp.]|uniref:hypothetical protein n=1 Tax=Frateuria sp. TaxID=2211372 RepID=UPI002DE68080|nr:hypothetical protein [Frateuria sp.]
MNMKPILCTVALLAAGAILSPAHADGRWAKTHPRRDQVNDRLQHQNKRIHEERKEGDLTKSQAAAMHKDDRQIRQEERDMAKQNGGHLTKQEQRTLNQQENQVSKDIGH